MNLTYKDSGVDKEAGYKEVQLIKPLIKKTFREGVISDLGGFSGLFGINKDKYEEPVLVSGTDGVGTKLMLAFKMDKHNTVGEDCVAMCVNDILCQGAEPIFFLDYISTGKLIPEKMYSIVEGVSNGCVKAGCALVGGETAEMPGLYEEDEYDLAGFAVGIVDKNKIIDGKKDIKEGDVILALPSTGVHSNGYSIVRKIIFEKMNYKLDMYIEELESTLGEELLKPTRIYTKPLLDLVRKFKINGISHITGGGLYENIPRALPKGLTAKVNTKKIEKHEIFNLLQKWGNVDTKEMYSTFNMGIGIVFFVNKDIKDDVLNYLKEIDEKVYEIGEVIKGEEGVILCH
ncbi:phosphoribosylformylglycinamidine cyclo-ligase [Miniphocaeibacter halophilus]|uniref:Phosphoribosylformylglycinamidine cyclo-ligase n=1 Tax=Miniphocaeibacter halophilus TaxID=2931922 RepID=A0AC61MQV6_9FIRM|nr:phosphoribosylformylglycinamidine cyclo-ligase [Miniphocaeibacter halophilus]QQK07992.1 phosphoribosylformylglycinamidine cyclo-ligase [Miniphocaeibacter halophilus]